VTDAAASIAAAAISRARSAPLPGPIDVIASVSVAGMGEGWYLPPVMGSDVREDHTRAPRTTSISFQRLWL
ncbi:MAG: hypothetical protein JWP70_1329, partial [Leifsonia sp.]|nr:hypothetical protein [Leifsonia sp.]